MEKWRVEITQKIESEDGFSGYGGHGICEMGSSEGAADEVFDMVRRAFIAVGFEPETFDSVVCSYAEGIKE